MNTPLELIQFLRSAILKEAMESLDAKLMANDGEVFTQGELMANKRAFDCAMNIAASANDPYYSKLVSSVALEILAQEPGNKAEWLSIVKLQKELDAANEEIKRLKQNSSSSNFTLQSMSNEQEPKYGIYSGHLYNRVSGKIIPYDEPVFILRAQDKYAIGALGYYLKRCCNIEHKQAIIKRIDDFIRFNLDYRERMKEPDTVSKTESDDE